MKIPENKPSPSNKDLSRSTSAASGPSENVISVKISGESSSLQSVVLSDRNITKRSPINTIPIPAKMFGKTVTRIKDFLDVARKEHTKGLPVVLVRTSKKPENNEETENSLGSDFMLEAKKKDGMMGRPTQTVHDHLDETKSISLLFFDGTNKEILTSELKKRDPSGFITENLMSMNLARKLHKFDDAEIRVTVAAALCLGIFGFTDTALADKILSPVDLESYAIGVHRAFQMAVDFSYHEFAQHMILWGANPNTPFEDDEREPLRAAEKNNDEKMVQILLDARAKRES